MNNSGKNFAIWIVVALVLVFLFNMFENGNTLRIVDGNNKVVREKVNILSSDGGIFYVPSLGKDIRIITGSNTGLIDGMTVNVIGQE